MKVKVLTEFIDRYTGELRKYGEILEVSKERVKESQDACAIVEEVEEQKKAKKDKK